MNQPTSEQHTIRRLGDVLTQLEAILLTLDDLQKPLAAAHVSTSIELLRPEVRAHQTVTT